jgi:hypothetical protein
LYLSGYRDEEADFPDFPNEPSPQRDVIDGLRLTPAEREDFGYIDWSAVERGDASGGFCALPRRAH